MLIQIDTAIATGQIREQINTESLVIVGICCCEDDDFNGVMPYEQIDNDLAVVTVAH